MKQTTRRIGKFALAFVFATLAASCGSGVLAPDTEKYDDEGECYIINGQWVCRPGPG